jgi:hypothetical protein
VGARGFRFLCVCEWGVLGLIPVADPLEALAGDPQGVPPKLGWGEGLGAGGGGGRGGLAEIPPTPLWIPLRG